MSHLSKSISSQLLVMFCKSMNDTSIPEPRSPWDSEVMAWNALGVIDADPVLSPASPWTSCADSSGRRDGKDFRKERYVEFKPSTQMSSKAVSENSLLRKWRSRFAKRPTFAPRSTTRQHPFASPSARRIAMSYSPETNMSLYMDQSAMLSIGMLIPVGNACWSRSLRSKKPCLRLSQRHESARAWSQSLRLMRLNTVSVGLPVPATGG